MIFVPSNCGSSATGRFISLRSLIVKRTKVLRVTGRETCASTVAILGADSFEGKGLSCGETLASRISRARCVH